MQTCDLTQFLADLEMPNYCVTKDANSNVKNVLVSEAFNFTQYDLTPLLDCPEFNVFAFDHEFGDEVMLDKSNYVVRSGHYTSLRFEILNASSRLAFLLGISNECSKD